MEDTLNTHQEMATYNLNDLTPFEHLRLILVDYLESRPHLSLNGLAKRCQISEPTLRRIRKGQLKNLPSISTVYELLSYIGQEKKPNLLVEKFNGPIGRFLQEKLPQIETFSDIQVSQSLTQSLKDPVKYLVFKLAANDQGVTLDRIIDLFGNYGENQLNALVQENLIEQKQDRYVSKIETFCLSNDVFVEHFKATADFIKVEKVEGYNRSYAPHFANCSTGINKKGYSEILRIQRAALKKIRQVMADPEKSGDIPMFYLCAVDTLDRQCADEF